MPSYREKRDFSRTNEPTFDPRTRPAGSATWKGAFVVHQHDATHLHYDLRLEAGGALLSFAVPKGPTLDPELKHFAAETEDHPLEYLDFEGVIPDLGVVRYLDQSAEDGLRDGKLHFALEGRKLRGRFGLVRLQGKGGKTKEWLLIKKVDAAARVGDLPAERPRSVLSGLTIEELREAPRLATEVEARASELVRSRGKAPRPLDGRKLSPMLCTLGELPDGAPRRPTPRSRGRSRRCLRRRSCWTARSSPSTTRAGRTSSDSRRGSTARWICPRRWRGSRWST
jgi:bifunctional non-homologous end joining protein LigD